MIDIHTHTVHSDGSSTVKEILCEAEKMKLSLLSITDHNTVQAYSELKDSETREAFSGDIITGVELNTNCNEESIEVLGYGFDITVMEKLLRDNYYSFEQKQRKEFELIKAQYKKIGVIFDESNVINEFNPKKGSSRGAFLREIIKYPDNHKFFLNNESMTNGSKFTRCEVYNPKSPLYVDESSLFPSLDKAIEIIHKAGGKAFLAHVYEYSPTIAKQLDNIIESYPFDGLECYHTIFTDDQSEYLVKLCEQKGLLMSGGSDFHGAVKPTHYLGVGHGNLHIDESIVKGWTDGCEKL